MSDRGAPSARPIGVGGVEQYAGTAMDRLGEGLDQLGHGMHGVFGPSGSGNAAGRTWIDWLPPGSDMPADDELITRDELLRRMAANGDAIQSRTLKIMEHQGLVPRPVRRRREGATRALYPPWVVHLALIAHDRRRRRVPAPVIRAETRGAAWRLLGVQPLRAEDV